MSEPGKAVFLSYASQDAEVAKKICDALRDAGVEVWFDQSELVGGDAWDTKIRGQIASCALFMPVISANTQARLEGYFRIEWKLAAQRTHAMADEKAFLVPVVLDDTRDAVAKVPVEFKAVQWTRLPGGGTTPGFVGRVKKLVSEEQDAGSVETDNRQPGIKHQRSSRLWWALPIFGVAMALLLVMKEGRKAAPEKPVSSATPAVSEARRLMQQALAIEAQPTSAGRAEFDAIGELLNRAVVLDPTDATVLAHAARNDAWQVFMGYDRSAARKQQAQTRAAKAAVLAPQAVETRWAKADVLAFADGSPTMLAEAEGIFRALVAESPAPNDVMLIEFGTVLRELKRYDEAAKLFERVGDRISAGWNYYLVARFDDARRMVRAAPRSESSLNLGIAVEWVGFEDLAAAARIVDGLTPQETLNADLVQFSAYVLLARREPERAIRLLNALPEEFFSSRGYRGPKRYYTGRAYALLGNRDAAVAEWRTALSQMQERLKASSSDPELLGTQAMLLASLGEKEEAERVRRLFVSLQSSEPEQNAVFADTVTLAQLGRKDEALARLGAYFREKPPRWRLIHALARFSPDYDPLRDDPRFEQLLRENLPEGAKSFDAPAKVDEKSVAVLAFANLSDDKANEYFSDGISEELLNVLAKIPNLKVSARTSAFFFKGKEVPSSEIAQQLGVAYLVTGSVSKQGDKVRIRAQLIKAADGFQVWSDSFTRDLKDIFAVQDEIAGLIAKNLQLTLSAGGEHRLASINPEAFELYVQARQAWNLRSEEGFARAEQLLNRALELAPGFARAHAALADVWYFQTMIKGITGTFARPDPPEFARVLRKIREALALDPGSAEAHASLGNVLFSSWKYAEAEREYQRAIELNPNYASAHQWLATLFSYDGRVDEALAECRRAGELDPLSSRIADNHGYALFLAGRYSEALAMYERAIVLQPSNYQAVSFRPVVLAYLGRLNEAVALARELPAAQPLTSGVQINVYALAGMRREAEALLPAAKASGTVNFGFLLLTLGRKEEAIARLDADACDLPGNYLLIDYDQIEDDPRFQKFIATIGWTEARARMKAWRAAHPPERPKATK